MLSTRCARSRARPRRRAATRCSRRPATSTTRSPRSCRSERPYRHHAPPPCTALAARKDKSRPYTLPTHATLTPTHLPEVPPASPLHPTRKSRPLLCAFHRFAAARPRHLPRHKADRPRVRRQHAGVARCVAFYWPTQLAAGGCAAHGAVARCPFLADRILECEVVTSAPGVGRVPRICARH